MAQGRQDDLRIAGRLERVVQLFPQFAVIVDLPIEGKHIAATPACHGLIRGLRSVENAQPTVAEHDVDVICPMSFSIRATVGQGCGHPVRSRPRCSVRFAVDAGDAAHGAQVSGSSP